MGNTINYSSVLGATMLVIWSGMWCPAAAEEAAAPRLTVNLLLPAHHLPELTAGVMKKEASRIWAREGVQITWCTSETDVPHGGHFIRLTLVADQERAHRPQQRYVLGDFLPEEGRIRVSMFAASSAAANSTAASRRSQEPFRYPLALGFILGRAIAHELGHALLGTTHAEAGLMMATFNPATMADSPSDRFQLTAVESARLSRSRLDPRVPRDPAESGEPTLDTVNIGRMSTR